MLRIHLILTRIRIRILDPHWKEMDPDPDNFFKIYWIFFTKHNIQIFFKNYFFAYFYLKTCWTIQKWGNFYNLFFQKFRGVKFFFFAVYGWYFTPCIRIFLRIRIRIRIQEARMLRIQRIRILSTALKSQP